MTGLEKKLQAVDRRFIYAGLVIFLSAVFSLMAHNRLVDVDEGYYLLASKMVAEGKILYRDFFYPQMPLLPHAYGLWMKIFGTSWYAARNLSFLFAVLLGVLIYFHLVQTTGKRSLGLLGIGLFAFNSFSIGWYPLVKTYSLSTALLFCAYLTLFSPSGLLRKYLWCGLFLGLAIDTRLYLIGIVPAVVACLIWLEKNPGNRFRGFFGLGLGLAGALSLNLFFALVSAENFIFNNVGYHFIRADYGGLEGLGQKMKTALKLIGIGATEPVPALQFDLLCLSGACFFIRFPAFRKKALPAVLFAAFILIFSFLPTPTYVQYASAAVPFLIIAAVTPLAQRRSERPSAKKGKNRPAWRRLWILAGFIYVSLGILDGCRYALWGGNVPGIELYRYADNWRIPAIQTISRIIDVYTTQTREPVISWWPGYFVESEAVILPGMENNFGWAVSPKLTPEERKKYRLVSPEEIKTKIREHQIHLVVLDTKRTTAKEALERHRLLIENGFEPVQGTGSTMLYKWKSKI